MSDTCCGPVNHMEGANVGRTRRVLWWALVINVAMFAVELIAGHAAGSMSLQADALDFLGDAGNYAISLLVVGMSLRARSGAALLKGATMAVFGVWVMGNTLYRLWTGVPPEPAVMGAVGMLALLANVGVAAMLYRFRDGDSNMQSVWICSRNDAFANVAVLAAAGLVAYTSSHWPDLAVAAIIAGLALSGAARVVRTAWAERRNEAVPHYVQQS